MMHWNYTNKKCYVNILQNQTKETGKKRAWHKATPKPPKEDGGDMQVIVGHPKTRR